MIIPKAFQIKFITLQYWLSYSEHSVLTEGILSPINDPPTQHDNGFEGVVVGVFE